MQDMEMMLKFMRQRALKHGFEYCETAGHYRAWVNLPLEKPIRIEGTHKHPAMALALIGVKLAEIAEV